MMSNPKYFAPIELIRSKTALAYKIESIPPTWEILDNLRELGLMLDIIRERYGAAISVTSGYRSQALNTKIKGSKTSQHTLGQAADLTCKDNARLFNTIKTLMDEGTIEVGQLIWEYGNRKQPDWVHVSLPTSNHHNEILYIGMK